MVRKHLRQYLQQQGYDVSDQEEKQIVPGIKADLIASSKAKTKRVLAIETKGSNGNAKHAAGQAAAYLLSDLISESYVGIPEDLLAKSPYIYDVCEAVGVGLFEVKEDGSVSKIKHSKQNSPIASVSLWGNRRNGAPDTSKATDIKLTMVALSNGARTEEEIISYIQRHRPRTRTLPPKENYCQVFIYDATQMSLIIRRLDGTYILTPLGKTILRINPSLSVLESEKRILSPLVFNFPVAYMILRILGNREDELPREEILAEGTKLENEIGMDGIFQTELRKSII